MNSHLTIYLEKRKGKLEFLSDKDKTMFEIFEKGLKDGAKIEVVYEIETKGGISYAKMSKLHKCIRDIAAQSGNDFESTKLDVKLRSGLCTGAKCKSFAVCTSDEIDLAIQECITIGDFLGINLR